MFKINPFRVLMVVATISLAICITFPDLQAAPLPRKLVVAQSLDAHWRTDAFAFRLPNATEPPTIVDFATCVVPGASATLDAGESFRVADVGQWQCGTPQEFYLLDAPTVDAFTFLRFNDGVTHTSFAVPPVGAISPDGVARIQPIVNDESFETNIDVLPTKLTRVFIDIYDAHNKKIAFETFDAMPPVAQYTLKTKLKVGALVITTGSYIETQPPLYGFVTVSAPDGGNSRVLPF